MTSTPSRIVVPVRCTAWLSGDLGQNLAQVLKTAVKDMPRLQVTRLPRGLLVEADEEPGLLLNAVHRGVQALERSVSAAYPVFHHEMGPVWNGTLHVIYSDVESSQSGHTG